MLYLKQSFFLGFRLLAHTVLCFFYTIRQCHEHNLVAHTVSSFAVTGVVICYPRNANK